LHHTLYPKQVGRLDYQIDKQKKNEIGEEFAFHASAADALFCGAKIRISGERRHQARKYKQVLVLLEMLV
jgi:hypothetical protein